MIDVIIIGGGASAIACAIELASLNKDLKIMIVERLDKLGKKILATGNGRCNLSNMDISNDKYHSNNWQFITNIDLKKSREVVLDFFNRVGVLLRTDNNRIYPYSNQATTIVEVFNNEIQRFNINVMYNFECINITKEKDYYKVFSNNDVLKAKHVVVATGGKSSPTLGSNGTGYGILEKLEHTTTKITPGLVQLKVKEKIVKDLKGQRIFAKVKLYNEYELLKELNGEVLFTDYGLSGICIMDLSSLIKDGTYKLTIDMMPEYSKEEILNLIKDKIIKVPNLKTKGLLTGIISSKIGYNLIKNTIANNEKEVSSLTEKEILAIANNIKEFNFNVAEKLSFDSSQVSCGGINTEEIDYITFESRINKNLYIIGELLDIDGMCGGYNLHFAWYSGITAARSINNKF